ncbi:site-specific DNA-methyltransferase [Psychrobacillus sp. FJAT-51614]|uniref:Site-specific DNA-methyltransferase n=1 Tax=Psychrobacillus mangrovi TaxID=3117745 RepID=A0ABU8F649_9BACI
MSDNYQNLIGILKEMFQLDQSDLDFGIYRIMNYKREEIEKFLNEDLLPQVKSELEKYISIEQKGVENELKKLKEKLEDAGVELESSSKYVALKSKMDNGINLTSAENDVFSHLANFFKRYYNNGDFISLRRYKKDVYAIPYEGQEVKLHWANADQYYIKTAEHFRDYTFVTPDNNKVHFKLINAITEKDNNKSQRGKEKRFIINQDEPVVIENEELIIQFEYVLNEQKQQDLNKQAIQIVSESIDNVIELRQFQSLLAIEPTERIPKRKLIEKYLNDYTSRNTFDYFIHKDLGGFLKRELDFYIKNEVMFLDDIDVEDNLKFEQYLTKIRVIKNIGGKIISFLEQTENFQKKLWLKKKFVVETNYCITLDKVPQEFYKQITENKRQIEEWKEHFAIDEIDEDLTGEGFSEPITEDFLKQNPSLLIDTAFFNNDFKESLISKFEDLDEEINGVLIHSENFQALNLLLERYKGVIKGIYTDPPYNTNASEILYKNNYKNSSWLSLMLPRIELSKKLLSSNGIACYTIDDLEVSYLKILMDQVYNKDNFLATALIRNNPSGRSTVKGFSINHEYALFYSQSESAELGRLPHNEQQLNRYDLKDENGAYEWENFRKNGTDSDRNDRPKQFYPIGINEEGVLRIPLCHWDEISSSYILDEDIQSTDKLVYPINSVGVEKVWKYGIDRARLMINEFIVKSVNGNLEIYRKKYLNEMGSLPRTWWDKPGYSARDNGTRTINDLFGTSAKFDFPKAVDAVADSIRVLNIQDGDTVLDFFAGSGTTGHAIINLNKEDRGNRKYVLVEMGEYFNTVTKPRIQKVVYSKDWKNGKPVSREGESHFFKYIRLESYEDTINNLEINLTQEQLSLLEKNPELREQYMLSYMLNNETENSMSLLNIDMFKNPFEYKLKIANGLETQLTTIDLVETFNYLLGIEVIRNEGKMRYSAEKDNDSEVPGAVKLSFAKSGEYVFKEVEGRSLSGDKVLVIWRTLSGDIIKDNAALDAYFLKKKYSTKDFEFNRIYVNGDNNLQNLKLDEERWKVVLIEEEFKKLMFHVQEV